MSPGKGTTVQNTPRFQNAFDGQEKMNNALTGEDQKDEDPILMQRARDFARMSFERGVELNRIGIENKIPIEKVLRTAVSRG